MRIGLIISIMISLTGCGKDVEKPTYFIDNAFITHTNSFYEAGRVRGYNVLNHTSIKFIEGLEGQAIGFCDIATQTIYIDKKKWYNQNIHFQELTIWHEMGHCQLGKLGHDSRVDYYGCPISIMYPELWLVDVNVSNYCKNFYYTHKDYYLDELFR